MYRCGSCTPKLFAMASLGVAEPPHDPGGGRNNPQESLDGSATPVWLGVGSTTPILPK